MKKVFIITEGTAKRGYVLIGRCSALYKAFEEKGILPSFIVNGDDSTKELLGGCKLFFNWMEEIDKLYSVMSAYDF